MRIETVKIYKSVHTWTGIIAGLLLYIAFVAGALTMFKQPLNQWVLQAETTLPAIPAESYDALLQTVLREHPAAAVNMAVHLPASYPQPAPISWITRDLDTHAETQWYASFASDGSLLVNNAPVSAVGEFLDHLHRTAGIPGGNDHDAIGTYILGVICALYFVALISGLIIFLATWYKDFLSLRRGKNRKRYWLDFHNVLGITSLPFHLIIACTTFVFAFHDPIYDAMQSVVYDGSPLFPMEASEHASRPLTDLARIADVTAAIEMQEPGFEAAEILYFDLGSAAAQLRVGGYTHGELARGAEYNYVLSDPFSGEPGYTPFLPSQADTYGTWVVSFFALHFGNFGGLTVRWIYFGLGLGGALLFLTGNILWIQSRQKKQTNSTVVEARSVNNMSRLTVGVSLGTLIGIAAALLTAKNLPQALVDVVLWQQAAYYLGFLGSIVWSFCRPPLVAAKQLALLTAVMILAIPLSGVWAQGVVSFGHGTAIHVTCLLAAGVMLLVYRKLASRPFKPVVD